MAWIAPAIIGGASLASGLLGSRGASKQANATRQAGRSAAQAERYKIDRSLAATKPVRDVGNAAMNALASLYIPGWNGLRVNEGKGGNSRYRLGRVRPNQFRQLPWNRFLLNESNDQLRNALALAGSPVGGNALSAISQNTANRLRADMVNPLMQLAGFGPAGAGMANQAIGNDATAAIRAATGTNVANAIGGQYASLNNALQGGVSNYLTYSALNSNPGNAWASPNVPIANSPAYDGRKYWGAQRFSF